MGENIGWINFANIGDFSLTLSNLPMNTQLYVAAYVKIGGQTITSGNKISITTTDPMLPTVIIALKIPDGVPVSSLNLKADVNGDCKIGHEEAIFVLQQLQTILQSFRNPSIPIPYCRHHHFPLTKPSAIG